MQIVAGWSQMIFRRLISVLILIYTHMITFFTFVLVNFGEVRLRVRAFETNLVNIVE